MAGLTLARRLTLARGLTLARRLTLGVSVAAILAGPALAQDRLRVGSAVSGELQSADARLGSGEFLDSYVLEGRAGQEVAIRLESPDFDPYLMIRGPGDLSEDNDDSGEGGVDSLLSLRLPADGEYRISATSYEAGETGRYRLSVAAGSAPVVESGADLTPGGALRGSLATGDDTLDSGEFLDTFTVSGRRGQTFTVTLRSSDFDPYVMVRGPGGLEEDNDDSGDRGSRDSRLTKKSGF